MHNVISASRRTDIPAFYGEWFANRINQGSVLVVNPFNPSQSFNVSLNPDDIAAIVFWTKNPKPFFHHLDLLDTKGYKFYFQFTITSAGEIFEDGVPSIGDGIDAFRELSQRYSPDHIQWRFDPIIMSNITGASFHLGKFHEICKQIKGSTKRCYFSFVDFYGKVKRAAEDFKSKNNIEIFDVEDSEKIGIANKLAEIAGDYGITLYSCCGDFLVNDGIKKAHCIDAEILSVITDRPFSNEERPTREGCGCVISKDIGSYDTCIHGCVYCYANANKEKAREYFRVHDSGREAL